VLLGGTIVGSVVIFMSALWIDRPNPSAARRFGLEGRVDRAT
jgi:hypothetical protein